MAFLDERLPEEVERGVRGGPRFNTTVLTLASGYEKRNINWEQVRGEWDVAYGLQNKSTDDIDSVRDLFYVAQGRANSFRFKDWADFTIGVDATDTWQEIGIGDNAETDFPIKKRYTFGAYTYARPITKPVSGTVRVALDGVEQGAGWTVDTLTGIVSFTVPPGTSVSVQVICEFDVPVRFDRDDLAIQLALYNVASIGSIPIVEVRGE